MFDQVLVQRHGTELADRNRRAGHKRIA